MKLGAPVLCLVLSLIAVGGEAHGTSTNTYRADLLAFCEQVDTTYPFFDLKGVRDDWKALKGELPERASSCRSDAEFLQVILSGIRCLRDAHMGVRSTKARPPAPPAEYYSGISFMPATDGRVVVLHPPRGLQRTMPTGTVVASIDGTNARELLDQRARKAWDAGGHFSSPQRARLLEYRIPLRGRRRGERHRITYVVGGRTRQAVIRSTVEVGGWPHTYNMPANLTQAGRSLRFAMLASGIGYMHMRHVDQSSESGMARAVDSHPTAKGWIIDLRGNGGGGYGVALLKRAQALPQPVAVLIDAGCMSAGETLARDIVRSTGARLLGSRTAGASSAKRSWAFPSGVATVTFSTRSRWRLDREPIEFNGIEPDEAVEVDPREAATGRNSAICRAEEYIVSHAKRLAALPRRQRWHAGDSLLANWGGDRYWYSAVVVKADKEKYLIRYGDGTEEWTDTTRMIEDDIGVGDTVSARWKRGKRFFPGTVQERDGPKVHIRYDDGDEEDTTIAYVRVMRPRAGE